MSNDLAETLRQQLMPSASPSPALEALLADYSRYHVVIAVLGSVFLLAVLGLTFACGRRAIRGPWTLERATALAVGGIAALVSAFLALLVAANISTVLSPVDGFTGALDLVGSPRPASSAGQLHQAFAAWLQSDSEAVPPLVRASIDDRLEWQRPKAVVCAVLLVGFVLLTAALWRAIVRRSRRDGPQSAVATAGILLAGAFTSATCLLLMLMVLGNTQGSIAPLSLTLFFG